MNTYIRSAEISDLQTICNVHAVTWKEAYRGLLPEDYLAGITPERWQSFFSEAIAGGSYHIALIQAGDTVTGCITFGPAKQQEKPGYGEIIAVYVLPQYWSKGYGYQLIRFALDQLKEADYQYCHIWVLAGNTRAINHYEKMGFGHTGETMEYAHDGLILNEVCYSYSL